MATIKQVLHRKNSSGSYDTIYLQSDMSNVTGTLGVANGGTGNTSVDTTPTSGSSKMCTSGGIYTELQTVKTSVSEGKASIASAITDKGVSTSSTASFATMSSNIRAIQTGIIPSGTKNISSNGTYDITTFANVSVSVNTVAFLKIFAPNTATDVYCEKDGYSVNAEWDSSFNAWLCKIPSLGTWTAHGTRDGAARTATVNISATYGIYDVTLSWAWTLTFPRMWQQDTTARGSYIALPNGTYLTNTASSSHGGGTVSVDGPITVGISRQVNPYTFYVLENNVVIYTATNVHEFTYEYTLKGNTNFTNTHPNYYFTY